MHTTNRSIPIKIDENVSQVGAGEYHSLFIKTDGSRVWELIRALVVDGNTTHRSNDKIDENVSRSADESQLIY